MVADNRYESRFALISDLKKSGAFDGDTIKQIEGMDAPAARKWFEANVNLKGLDGADIESLWNKKVTLSIEADGGEEVEVLAPEAPAPDEASEMEEEPEGEKARKASSTGGRLAKAAAPSRAPSFGGRISGSKAAYERAVRDGTDHKGYKPPFADGDTAEAFGAWARLTIAGDLGYDQKSNDEAIVRNVKDLGITNNNLGGALIPQMFEAELIKNRTRNSAAARACGVKTIPIGEYRMPRLIDDVTVSVVGDGAADSEQDGAEFDSVDAYPREVRGLVRISRALLNDSAIDVVSEVGDSFARAYGKFEDRNFLGDRSWTSASPSYQGILDKIGSNTTNDTALSSDWGDMTVADIQSTIGLTSDRAWDSSDRLGFICSRPFYDTNMERFAVSAGGNTGSGIYSGFRGGSLPFDADAMWNGYPVWFSSLMPRTYSADQASLLFGAFDAACKFAVVSGSEELQTSEHRYFENNQIGVRVVKRVAFNAHDVNDTADPDTGSMVVAQQD